MKSVLNLLKIFVELTISPELTICPELPKIADGRISGKLEVLTPEEVATCYTSPILYPSIYTYYTHNTPRAIKHRKPRSRIISSFYFSTLERLLFKFLFGGRGDSQDKAAQYFSSF